MDRKITFRILNLSLGKDSHMYDSSTSGAFCYTICRFVNGIQYDDGLTQNMLSEEYDNSIDARVALRRLVDEWDNLNPLYGENK